MKKILLVMFLGVMTTLSYAQEPPRNYGYIAGEAPAGVKERANKESKKRKWGNPFKILFDFDKSLRPVLW